MAKQSSSYEKGIRLYRNRLRTKALMYELSSRAAMPFSDTFASWFDQEMMRKGLHKRANTAESNRWIGSFKGRTALQREQLDLLQELFNDAHDFYSKGPSSLWIAMWGDISKLWPLCKTRTERLAHFKTDDYWEYERFHEDSGLDICEALRFFEGEIMLATETNYHDLPIGYLVEAIALYRLHSHTSQILTLNIDGVGAYRSIYQCLFNAEIMIALMKLDILDDIKEETILMEANKIMTNKSYCEAIGFIYPPSKETAMEYAKNPLAMRPNEERWDDLEFDWVNSDA